MVTMQEEVGVGGISERSRRGVEYTVGVTGGVDDVDEDEEDCGYRLHQAKEEKT